MQAGWSYRQEISFNNPGAKLTNFQVNFTRETISLVANSKAQPDASDIRIVDANNQDLNFGLKILIHLQQNFGLKLTVWQQMHLHQSIYFMEKLGKLYSLMVMRI